MSGGRSELRLFVAVELPETVRAALAETQTALRRMGLEKLRWVRPEGIHLTLKFLGETPESRVAGISDALSEAATGCPAHRLVLGRLGTFGGRTSPRVLWVDVTGDVDRVRELQASVDAALSRLGFAKEDRAFSPHLTLARVRPESARELAPALAAAVASAEPPEGRIDVREVSLMQSTLGAGGAVYQRLASFPLAGTA